MKNGTCYYPSVHPAAAQPIMTGAVASWIGK